MIKDTRRTVSNKGHQSIPQTNTTISTINRNYVLSCRASIKILEIVSLIIAMLCMVQYDDFWTCYPSNMVLFYVVVCVSWILQLAFFVMMVFSLEDRLPGYHWDLCAVLGDGMETVVLIVVASLLANDALRHRKLEWKGDDMTGEIKHYFNSLIAAVVMTFTASLLFVIDAILHSVLIFKSRRQPYTQESHLPSYVEYVSSSP